MLQGLGIGVTAWRIGVKRFGPAGGIVLAVAAMVAFVSLKRYLRREHPDLEETLERVV